MADATNPQGVWRGRLNLDSYMLPVNVNLKTASQYTGSTIQMYSDAAELFVDGAGAASSLALGTNAYLDNQRIRVTAYGGSPDNNPYTLGSGVAVTSRIMALPASGTKASDIQIQFYVLPKYLFSSF